MISNSYGASDPNETQEELVVVRRGELEALQVAAARACEAHLRRDPRAVRRLVAVCAGVMGLDEVENGAAAGAVKAG